MRNARAARNVAEPPESLVKRLETRDLSRARTLQLLEEVRANLADHYDFAPIGFVTLDAKGCIRELNVTAARMFGRARSQLHAQPFFTQVAKPHVSAFLNHLHECRARHEEIITDIAVRDGRGGARPVELRSVPVLNPLGVTVYRTAITDITARLRAGSALRESEERYRQLVELSPDGIFILRDGLIAFANPAAARLCGVEAAAALIGGDPLERVRPAFRKALGKALLARAPSMPAVEAQILRLDQTEVSVEVIARRFRHEGEPAVLWVARDVSRRKDAERQVVAIAERERMTFGRDLHDSLCQSLLGVAYLADLLAHSGPSAAPETIAARAEEIARVVRDCAEEARTLSRGLCPVKVGQIGLVAALQEMAADMTRRTRIPCTMECEEHLHLDDMGVATNLYRVAQEAVTNAIKHGKPKAILIQLAAENGTLTLRVRDDGKGIPEKPRRSGMGLHTMQYRATMIGGSLEVRRLRPRGTVVSCSIPVR